MKKLAIVATAVVAAITVPSLVITNKVDTQVQNIINQFNEAPGYQVTLNNYKKGWFSNSGTVQVSFSDPLAAMNDQTQQDWSGDMSFDVNFESKNGPINGMAFSQFKIEIPADALREYIDWQESQSIYEFSGTVDLSGNVSFEDKIAKFTIKENPEFSGSYSGYQGTATTDGEQIHHVANYGELEIIAKDKKFLASDISSVMTFPADAFAVMTQMSWYESNLKFNIGDISLTNLVNDTTELTMNNAGFEANSTINDDETMASGDFAYFVGKATTPTWSGSDFKLGMEFNKLNLDFFKNLNDFFKKMETVPLEQQHVAFLDFFETNLLSLLVAEPEFNLTEVTATLPEGKLNAHLNTKLVGVSSLPAELTNGQFWLSHLQGDSVITLDKPVLSFILQQVVRNQLSQNPQLAGMPAEQVDQIVEQQSAQMIAIALQQGFVVEKNEQYVTTLKVQDSIAKINSVELPLGSH